MSRKRKPKSCPDCEGSGRCWSWQLVEGWCARCGGTGLDNVAAAKPRHPSGRAS